MKPFPTSTVVLLACLCVGGCRSVLETVKPPHVDTEAARLGREERQQFDRLFNKGTNCLEWARLTEIRETQLLKYKAPDSEELMQTVRAQRLFLEQAEGCFREALRLAPNSMPAHQALCQATAKLGKYDDAIEHGLLVLEKAPSKMPIYRDVATAYQRKGSGLEGSERIKYYEKAVQIILKYAPRDGDRLNQAQMYAYMGEICFELAKMLTGPDRIAQCDRIIRFVGGYLEQYPNNPFSKDMQAMVGIARDIKVGFEMGYE